MFVGQTVPTGARGQTSRQGFRHGTDGTFVKTGRPLPSQVIGEMPDDLELDAGSIDDYPRMLYGPDFYAAQQFTKEFVLEGGTPRETAKQMREYEKALQTMAKQVKVVHTPEDEEEWLTQGWTLNPVDHAVKAGLPDPRIPTGLEAKRAAAQRAMSVDEELRQLRRRYAALTGQRIDDEAPEDVPPVQGTGAVEAEVAGPAPASRRGRPRKKSAAVEAA